MLKITDKNDFTLTIQPYCMMGDVREDVSLIGIDNLTVEIPNAPLTAYTWSVDEQGRLVLDIDGLQMEIRTYGISVTGTINGRDWHWAVRRLFEVVKYTIDSNVTDYATVDVVCEPAGASVTLLQARFMTQSEYDALEVKEQNKIYITKYEE